jgi:hypothetical protein
MLQCWNAPRTPPHRLRQSIRRHVAQAAPSWSACIRAELAILQSMVLSITMPANHKLPPARRAYAGLQPDEPEGLNKRRLVLNVLGCERCDSHRRGSFVPQHSVLYHHTISSLNSSLAPSPAQTNTFLINHTLHHLSQCSACAPWSQSSPPFEAHAFLTAQGLESSFSNTRVLLINSASC